MMNNCVNINIKTDRIIIKINEDAEQAEILECLNEKLKRLKRLYQDDDTPIVITGKVLKNREIDEIQELIGQNINVKVSFDSPRILGLHGIKKTYNKKITTSETKFQKGSVRSGQKLEFEGSLVIIGDVNDGAEVIAGENIVILGALRGLAHAGAKGNKGAIIAAAAIEAPQLRIADKIKERERKYNDNDFSYAYIGEDDEIVLN